MADNKQGASQASQMNELPRLRRISDDRTHTLNELNVIGRHVDCDLFIDDEKGVSRKHARVTVEDGVVYVEDLGSLNGTLINGLECEGKQALTNGDILIFDELEYELFVPYEACDDFDPAMTVIADRSEIMKRIEKQREEKNQEAAETSLPAPVAPEPFVASTTVADAHEPPAPDNRPRLHPGTVEGASPGGKAANHTIIDQPRKSAPPSMRIVDEDFLREVQGEATGNDPEEAQKHASGTLSDTLDDSHASSLDHQTTAQMSAIHEAFDVSDDEVDEILHNETPGGAPTRFVPHERDAPDKAPLFGSAPFLTRKQQLERSSTEAAAFIRGTERSTAGASNHGGTDSDVVHAQLIVLDGGRHYRLSLSGDRTSWSVGSADTADVRIAHQGVADDHAIILKEDTTWTLCDRGAAGGCSVNGHEVSVARIQLGDRLRIGSAECLFAATENVKPPEPAPPARAPAPGPDPFGEDPMDTPRMRIEIPMDDRIWDEHEQQLYRDTSRDRILRERKQSSRHEPEVNAAPRSQKPGYSSWEPPANYGRPSGLTRFMPSKRILMIAVPGVIALAVLGALAYLIL